MCLLLSRCCCFQVLSVDRAGELGHICTHTHTSTRLILKVATSTVLSQHLKLESGDTEVILVFLLAPVVLSMFTYVTGLPVCKKPWQSSSPPHHVTNLPASPPFSGSCARLCSSFFLEERPQHAAGLSPQRTPPTPTVPTLLLFSLMPFRFNYSQRRVERERMRERETDERKNCYCFS